jgi:acetyl-CoA carboxylase biotin carboxylase subunit
MFRKVLVANRGEIALRVIRACRELGVGTVAVYSEADALAPHVRAADEAVCIGPPPSAQSYLLGDRIVAAAHECGAEAIHPGYGFLSERAWFARAVREAGLVFVGPPAEAIEAMGSKTAARQLAVAAGVPVVPGTTESVADADEALALAHRYGFPVLLKAAAGGGGKGMRVVRDPAGLEAALASARREAQNAFGDDAVYIEKYIEGPRHVEVQVLADGHGTVLHLGERECSVQRRHQKMIEEAPSVAVDPALRARMGATAVAAARAAGYVNAGTCEFLLDRDGAYYFLEMNTRIQVEHPVTELVMGLDLVQWQLRIAAGERLPFAQETLHPTGWAIECRITSEDAANGFLPSTGRVTQLRLPGGPGVRWDGGIEVGTEVGLFYDPMLAKLIVHAPTRALAIARMRRALQELAVDGVDTSRDFHLRVLAHPDFQSGAITIQWLEQHLDELTRADAPAESRRLAAVAAALAGRRQWWQRAGGRPVDGRGRRGAKGCAWHEPSAQGRTIVGRGGPTRAVSPRGHRPRDGAAGHPARRGDRRRRRWRGPIGRDGHVRAADGTGRCGAGGSGRARTHGPRPHAAAAGGVACAGGARLPALRGGSVRRVPVAASRARGAAGGAHTPGGRGAGAHREAPRGPAAIGHGGRVGLPGADHGGAAASGRALAGRLPPVR